MIKPIFFLIMCVIAFGAFLWALYAGSRRRRKEREQIWPFSQQLKHKTFDDHLKNINLAQAEIRRNSQQKWEPNKKPSPGFRDKENPSRSTDDYDVGHVYVGGTGEWNHSFPSQRSSDDSESHIEFGGGQFGGGGAGSDYSSDSSDDRSGAQSDSSSDSSSSSDD